MSAAQASGQPAPMYKSIALVDLSYLFKRNYMAMARDSAPGAAAQKTLDNLAGIRESVAHVIVCLDAPPYRRVEAYADYKGTRPRPEPEEIAQKKWLIDRIRKDGYQVAKCKGYEADDVIATLASLYGEWCPDVRLVASDKDIAQCVTKNVVQIVPPVGERKAERRDRLAVKVKFGVYPEEMPLYQALVGDAGDNIPGITGIGPKTAALLVSTHKTLEGLAVALATGKQKEAYWVTLAANWEQLRLWLTLVMLDKNVPLDAAALLTKIEPEPMDESGSMDAEGEMLSGMVGNAATAPDEYEPENSVARNALNVAAVAHAESSPSVHWHAGPYSPDCEACRAEDRLEDKLEDTDGVLAEVGARMAEAARREEEDRQRPSGVQPIKPANETKEREPVKVTEAQFDPISAPPGVKRPPMPPMPTRDLEAVPASAAMVYTPPNYGLVTEDLQPLDLCAANTVSKWIFKSKLYPQFTSDAAVFTIIARGKELGIGMTTALAGMHMIEGKPSASADLIRALAKRDPKCKYFRLLASTAEYAEWETWHTDDPEPQKYRYDLSEAHLAGLRGGNWQKRPRDMLAKTASSKLARLVYPGATLGLYCPEEMSGNEYEEAA